MPAKTPLILIIDDDADVRESLELVLKYEGFEVAQAAGGSAGLDIVDQRHVDVVLLDVKMPGMDGMEALGRILEIKPAISIIMISGHGDIRMAVDAVKRGAEDFLEKPLDADRTSVIIRNALRRRSLETDNKNLREQIDQNIRWIGASEESRRLADLADRAARSHERILIVGESGVGKELLARRIHAASARRDGPFEVLACAAIPDELVEDEFFGHAPGAFTGATGRRAGAFERAAGGTLLLDEIGELPLDAQAKLLRVLETGSFSPLGGDGPMRCDVRVLATTQQNLRAAVDAGKFRSDLFFRLSVLVLTIPPLRERPADIIAIAREFLTDSAKRLRRKVKKLTPEAEAQLRARPWRGNVRELRNVMDALALTVEEQTIELIDLKSFFEAQDRANPRDPFDAPTLDEFRNLADRIYLERRIAAMNGNLKRTATVLGISRSNLYKTLERVGLKPPPNAVERSGEPEDANDSPEQK
ncbi:MAG: sigma-54-dependent Fis family transcriptional regulator [Planctomycetes bacterium]|nr:sigma-54-dependent Fis family transcriptional regulator [Planctomycetota bacterium]